MKCKRLGEASVMAVADSAGAVVPVNVEKTGYPEIVGAGLPVALVTGAIKQG